MRSKRVGYGLRDFDNYRTRPLPYCGVDCTLHPPQESEAALHAWSRRPVMVG